MQQRMARRVAHTALTRHPGSPYAINVVLHTPTQGGPARYASETFSDVLARLSDLPVAGRSAARDIELDGPTQLPDDDDRARDGHNVRVGMEATCSTAVAKPAQSNAQLVERTVRIAAELDRRPATPARFD